MDDNDKGLGLHGLAIAFFSGIVTGLALFCTYLKFRDGLNPKIGQGRKVKRAKVESTEGFDETPGIPGSEDL